MGITAFCNLLVKSVDVVRHPEIVSQLMIVNFVLNYMELICSQQQIE